MKTVLHEQRISSVLGALVTIALGVLLIWWPNRSMEYLCLLLGASILAIGAIYMIGWFIRRKSGVPSFFVLPGVILCALGVWLMTSPDSVIILIQYIFGAVLVFHGLLDLKAVFVLMRQRYANWWADLLLALVTAGLGAMVLLNPFGTFAALVVLIGVALVFDGVSDLVIIFRLSRSYKAVERRAAELAAQAEPVELVEEPQQETIEQETAEQ